MTPRSDVTKVNVNIVRNQFAPVFTAVNYTSVIAENFAINREIVKVNATDNDYFIPLSKDVSPDIYTRHLQIERLIDIWTDREIYKQTDRLLFFFII